MLEITDSAINKIKEIIEKQGKEACLRIFMVDGCCGPSLAMEIVSKPEKEDSEVEIKNFKFYIHQGAALQLVNATIDCDEDGGIIVKGVPGHNHGHADGHGCGDDCGCGH